MSGRAKYNCCLCFPKEPMLFCTWRMHILLLTFHCNPFLPTGAEVPQARVITQTTRFIYFSPVTVPIILSISPIDWTHCLRPGQKHNLQPHSHLKALMSSKDSRDPEPVRRSLQRRPETSPHSLPLSVVMGYKIHRAWWSGQSWNASS